MTLKNPDTIAREIVDRFPWSSNVILEGRLVGQQVIVAQAIADAIRADRAAQAAIWIDDVKRLRDLSETVEEADTTWIKSSAATKAGIKAKATLFTDLYGYYTLVKNWIVQKEIEYPEALRR